MSKFLIKSENERFFWNLIVHKQFQILSMSTQLSTIDTKHNLKNINIKTLMSSNNFFYKWLRKFRSNENFNDHEIIILRIYELLKEVSKCRVMLKNIRNQISLNFLAKFFSWALNFLAKSFLFHLLNFLAN